MSTWKRYSTKTDAELDAVIDFIIHEASAFHVIYGFRPPIAYNVKFKRGRITWTESDDGVKQAWLPKTLRRVIINLGRPDVEVSADY